MKISTLRQHCAKVFKYLRKRRVNSTMTLEPTDFSVTGVVKKLGFTIQQAAGDIKGRKQEMEVVLDAKEEERTYLSLSYYSNALMGSFIMDVCIGMILTRYFV